MAPIFSREDLLTSPSPPVSLIAAFSPEFAVLGQLDVVNTLLSTLHTSYPLHGLQSTLAPLRLAFAAANSWPAGYSDAEKDAEALKSLAQDASDDLWPASIDEEHQAETADGLKAVLEAVGKLEKLQNANDDDDEDDDELDDVETDISEGLVKALDISIKVNGAEGKDALDGQSAAILTRIAQRLHAGNQIDSLTQSARAWPFLLKGVLAKEAEVNDAKVKALGKDVNDAVSEWFAKGPQPGPHANKPLKELLQVCDAKTREHWPEEAGEDHPKPDTLFAKDGAKDAHIKALEKKLDITLPADYKEFLSITDGFGRILGDDVFEAPLHEVGEVDWMDAKEAVKGFDDDDDDDDDDEDDEEDDDGEAPEGPPAKKMKMMDGNKLLALAKEAESKRGGGTSSSATAAGAGEDAEMDDDDDDDDEDADLEAALANAVDWPDSLKVALLDLPDLMHEAYAEEHDAEWPDIEKVVEVGGDEGTQLWLLPPAQVQKARDVYIKMYEQVDEEQKKTLRWAMTGFAGSEDAFRKYEGWAFVGFVGAGLMSEGDVQVWPSFRRYLEDMADNCSRIEKVEDEEEAERMNGCFAYRCR